VSAEGSRRLQLEDFEGWMESPKVKIFLVILFAHRSVINESIIWFAENSGCYVY